MHSQGAVEYVIILGVVIIIAVITVVSISNIDNFKFIIVTESNLNNIENLLSEVALQHVISSSGSVQANLRSVIYNKITQANLTITSLFNETCNLSFGVVSDWTTSNSDCQFLNGTVADQYIFKCVVSYIDNTGVSHNKLGICKGIYEEG